MKLRTCFSQAGTLLVVALGGAIGAGQAYADGKPQVTENPRYVDSRASTWRPCQGLPGCEFLPLRGNASREASEAIFRLAAGVSFPKHWHTSAEHILVIEGQLKMRLENGDQYIVGPHTFLYNPAAMIHWGSCGEEQACVYYVYDDQPYDIHLVK